MKPAFSQSPAYSADVRMELRLNGHIFAIAQMGPNFLLVKNPIHHPPVVAEIAMSIDGEESRWPVRLDQGMSAAQERISITRCD
jgi:hypothetical protein